MRKKLPLACTQTTCLEFCRTLTIGCVWHRNLNFEKKIGALHTRLRSSSNLYVHNNSLKVKTLIWLYFCLILEKGTFLRISTIGKCSFLTLTPPYSSGHARKHWNHCMLLVCFSPPILAVRARGSELGRVGGRGVARWPIPTIRSLATLLGFFGNLEVKSIWRPQKRHAFLTDSIELFGTFFQNQTELRVHVLNTLPTIFFLFLHRMFFRQRKLLLKKIKRMINNHTRFRENKDLPLWRAPALRQKPPYVDLRALKSR